MKKHLLLFAVLLCSVAVSAKTLYLKAGAVDFTVDGAVVAIWTWGGSDTDAWSVFQATGTTGISSTTIAEGRTGGKLVRFPGGTTPDWNATKWNETGNLQWDSSKDCMELIPNADNSWDGLTGVTWTTYDGSAGGGDNGNENGNENGGNQGGSSTGTTGDFYLIGEWNGQVFGDGDDYANFIEENKMTDCKISKTFTDSDPARSACWIRVKMMLNGGSGWMFYSTDDWQGDGKQTITLYSAEYLYQMGKDGTSNRWSVPTNQKLNITLEVVNDHEVKLSLVDDATYAAHDCGDYVPDNGGGNGGGNTGGDLTVRFQKPDDWSTVNIYAWGGTSFGEWPGSAMTDDGNGWWSARITAGTSIIFNNANGTQTQNIEGVTSSTCYTLGSDTDSEGHYSVNVSTDCPALENALQELDVRELQVEKGRITAKGALHIFNIAGQDVTALNGNLQGLYIVRIGNAAHQVIVP